MNEGEQMQMRGLLVAEPLGFGERRNRGVVTGCISFQHAISDSMPLRLYIENHCSIQEGDSCRFTSSERSHSQPGLSNELLQSLGRLVHQMRAAGFRYTDFHAGNVLVNAASHPSKVWLVDLHAFSRFLPFVSHGRLADLAKLFHALRDSLNASQLNQLLAGYKPESSE